MNKIRVGILGAARIAPKAIITPVRDNPEFEIVAVGARDKDRAKAFAAEHNIPHIADGYSDLVTRDDVDLVFVALPPAGHAPWSIAALEAGKAVLCEKPFAMTSAEARTMVTAATKAGRPLIEAFHYRYHAVLRRAFAIAASGELGRLVEAEAVFDVNIAYKPGELRWIPSQGGGALMDLGCYCVHVLRMVAGSEPSITSADCQIVHEVDETTVAELAFPGGFKAKLRTSMKAPAFTATLHVQGEKGSMDISNFLAPQMGCEFTVEVGGKTRHEPTDGLPTYSAQLAHVGDVMLRGTKPLTGGADAIATMECIEAIYAAAGYKRPI